MRPLAWSARRMRRSMASSSIGVSMHQFCMFRAQMPTGLHNLQENCVAGDLQLRLFHDQHLRDRQLPMQFTPWDNPMGTDGFEFIEYAAPDPGGHGRAVRAHGLQADRAPPPQERDAVPPGRDQFHRQCRARLLRAALRAPARAEHLRHRLPRAGRRKPPTSARSRSAPGATPARRARASSTSRPSRASATR